MPFPTPSDTTMKPALTLHGVALSGHCHRVALMLTLLGLPFDQRDAPAPVRASAAFLQLNPLGQIPVLQDGDLVLCDSNAILVYLAKQYGAGTQWLPEDPQGAAQVQRWLSIAAGEIAYGPARARVVQRWGDAATPLQREREVAARVLAFMDQHLADRRFLAASHPTIADLACYAYVAAAPEGGVELAPFAHVRQWLGRIEAMPGFIAMPA
jgi:glutathione S-transferase